MKQNINTYLINKREGIDIYHFEDPKAFIIEYLNDMHDVYKNINNYNVDMDPKILMLI